MDQVRPSMEAELRALADRVQIQQMTLVSGGMLALLFIFFARNVIRFGTDIPAWTYGWGALLLSVNVVILILSSLNRIPERHAQLTGVALLLLHGFATYTNLIVDAGAGIYSVAFTVLALSMCVLSMTYFQATLAIYLAGWLIAVNFALEPSQWIPTLLLLVVVSALSYFTLRYRLRALKRHLILESRVLELESYLPLCANCSSVRDKSGEWLSLEDYMESNQGKKVTHGVCPSCKEELYGDYLANRNKNSPTTSATTEAE